MKFQDRYDIAIIGGGIGGLMTAYRLAERDPGLSICLMERGRDIRDRVCPIVAGKVKKCIKCDPCAIMEGLAGAGAFSDGKYVISTEYGGWLTDFLPDKTVIDYIEQADHILVEHGAVTERFLPDNDLKRLCLEHDLHMQQAQVKHLGTDANFETMGHLIDSSMIQYRILNRRRGPAVQAPRAQADKFTYSRNAKQLLEHTANLSLFMDTVVDLMVEDGRVIGVEHHGGVEVREEHDKRHGKDPVDPARRDRVSESRQPIDVEQRGKHIVSLRNRRTGSNSRRR